MRTLFTKCTTRSYLQPQLRTRVLATSKKNKQDAIDVNIPTIMLKNALPPPGKLNQIINQPKITVIKPSSLPNMPG